MNNLENNTPQNEQILGQKYRGLVLAGMLMGLANLSNPALAQTQTAPGKRGPDSELELTATKTACKSKCEAVNRRCMSAAREAQNKSGATLQCSETVQGCKAECEKITKPGDTSAILNLPSTGATARKEETQREREREPEPAPVAIETPAQDKYKNCVKDCQQDCCERCRQVVQGGKCAKDEATRKETAKKRIGRKMMHRRATAKPAATTDKPVIGQPAQSKPQPKPQPKPFEFTFCPVPEGDKLIGEDCQIPQSTSRLTSQPSGAKSTDEAPYDPVIME